MRTLLSVLLIVVFAQSIESDAEACSFILPENHVVVSNEADSTPPVIENISYEVIRLHEAEGCEEPTSCTGILSISIALSASDDISPRDRIGFAIDTVSGITPVPPNRPVLRATVYGTNGLRISLLGNEENYSGVIRIIPIDEAGNQGEAVLIDIETREEAGCVASSTRTGLMGLLWVTLALLLVSRRGHSARRL